MDEKRKATLCLIQGYLNGKYEDLGFEEFQEKLTELLELYGLDPKLTKEDSKFFELELSYAFSIFKWNECSCFRKMFDKAQKQAYEKGAKDKEVEINNKVTSDLISHLENENNPNREKTN